MANKYLEEIGAFIAKTRDETLGKVDQKLYPLSVAIEESQELIGKTKGELVNQIEALQAHVDSSVDNLGKEQSENHVGQIQALTEQLKAQEVFEAQLQQRLEEIKDGKDGESIQGPAGLDGQDMPLLEPVALVENKDYEKNILGTHGGGLWISTKKAVGNPDDDPLAWHCILDAMSSMSIDMLEDHTFKLSVKMGTGALIEDTFNIPYPEHKGIWEEGKSYASGEIVTKGHAFWQCIEDTDGAPPGNGWQQILTAPRGKTGPAGKSITGPQGVPGRNGTDGKDAEIDWDIQKVFVEGLIYTDLRSASYPLRSFRGWWSEEESYLAGDVVRENNVLLVVTEAVPAGTKYRQASQYTEVMMQGTGPAASIAAEPVPWMLWKGAWVPGTYAEGNTVVDNGWTMVCIVDETTERPAPVYVGDPSYIYDGTIGSDSDVASQIIIGNRYFNDGHNAVVTGYRVDMIVDYTYDIYIVRTPTTTPVSEQLRTVVADATGWKEYSVDPAFVPKGVPFDVVAVVRAPDPAPDTFSGTWDYSTPGNPKNDPADGEMFQPDNNPDQLWVANEDELGADISTDLATLEIGDTITDGLITWTIQSSINEITWWRFTVTPITQSIEGVKQFTFTRTAPKTTTYSIDTDYWLTEGSLNEGLHIADGIYADIVPDESAYGIDLIVQLYTQSADWDTVSDSGTTVGSAQLGTKEVEWVERSASVFDSVEGQTTDDQWQTISISTPVLPGTARHGEIVMQAKRVDADGYHASKVAFLLADINGTIEAKDKKIYEVETQNLDIRVETSGSSGIVQVKGMMGQTWDWYGTDFVEEID